MKSYFKLSLSLLILFIGIYQIYSGSVFGGLILVVAGALILPFISEKFKGKYKVFVRALEDKFPSWKNLRRSRFSSWNLDTEEKIIKLEWRVLIISLLFIGFYTSLQPTEDEARENKRLSVIETYIRNNNSDNSINNLHKLAEIRKYYGYLSNSYVSSPKNYLEITEDENTGITTYKLNPEILFEKLPAIDREKIGKIISYQLEFKLNADNEIISRKTIVGFSEVGVYEIHNDSIDDISYLFDSEKIEAQKLAYEEEEINRKQRQEYERRVKEFEKKCISEWDGAQTELKQLIEKNLHDPSSFEHVETSYRLNQGYAVVVMKYRAKNAFNAKILNSVTAKVSIENCSVIQVYE